ncbi:hypothetical protein OSC27_04550 [Microbacterium sp. STN6]|uniref:hypothetical protein n=1 Tax=Microbacterium sp. STN6 TaxID=2995588 RepID=UPI002260E413|nr:hypothetical protein [Microbacterium sp. STN6]MCX7521548.1 hypothetical protein [Microbacterium sp. STN6]
MTSDLDSTAESTAELRHRRVFRVQIWAGAGIFLIANVALYQWGETAGEPWKWLLAVVPLVPIAWIVIVIVRRMRTMDEYQVKLFFPGLAVGFAVAMVAAITVGTLSSAGFDVINGGWAVAVLGLLGWEFTNLIVGAPKA